MGCSVGKVMELVERIAPRELAEEWDNVGLQFGAADWQVDTVMVALEVDLAVLEEARERGAGMVICHHPPIFRPLRSMREDEPQGRLASTIARSGIAVYAAHSNLDASPQGVNAALAEALGLVSHRPLPGSGARTGYKLVTFLPPEEVDRVSEALFSAGAGHIGDYRGCSFRVEGTGTFTAAPSSQPAYGVAGAENRVSEVRLEVWVGEGDRARAEEALLSAHPYEEPVIDVYEVRSPSRGGMGRVGEAPRRLRLGELAALCRERLGSPVVKLAGDPEREVGRVAVCGGRGSFLAGAAREAGAEVLVTGDVGHHEAQEALRRGLAIIDAGHYHTERTVVPHLAGRLAEMASEEGVEVRFVASVTDTSPWSTGGEG